MNSDHIEAPKPLESTEVNVQRQANSNLGDKKTSIKEEESSKPKESPKSNEALLANPKDEPILKEKILVEKKNVEPDIGFESRLTEAITVFGVHRPKNRLEVDYEDITKIPTPEELKSRQTTMKNAEIELKQKTLTQSPTNVVSPINNGQLSYNDGQGQLFYAKKAFIDQYYEIRDFFGLCPLYYRYHISLDYANDNQPPIHLFDVKDISTPCGHDWCPNQARAINLDIFQFPLNKTRGPKTKFATIEKPYRCACSCLCACCNRPTMNIRLSDTEELIGKVVEQSTVCDPVILVYDVNDEVDWKITGSFCQNGYCCRDLIMGKCSTCDFNIFNAKDTLQMHPTGRIRKRNVYGMKEKPDVDQIEIEFPANATPKEKLTLIAAGLMVVFLYFQNGSNAKKCHVEKF